MKLFARYISFVLHPIFVPVYMAFIIVGTNPIRFAGLYGKHYNIVMGMLAMLMVGFPLISIALMKALGFIQSFQMKGVKERFIPMIAVATFYLWAYTMFKPNSKMVFAQDALLSNMLLGCVLGVFFAFFFNSFYKISLHSIAMGGLVAVIMNIMPISPYNLLPLFLLVILLAGLVASTRLILKAHSPKEVYMGLLAGYFAQFIAYNILGKLAESIF